MTIECNFCSVEITKGSESYISFAGRKRPACSSCAADHMMGTSLTPKDATTQSPTEPPTEPVTSIPISPEAQNYLRSISITSSDNVIDPADPGDIDKPNRISLGELFKRSLNKGQFIIAECAKKGDIVWGSESYKELEYHIALLESITYEAKAIASELTNKKRTTDAASGRNRWDKERKGENKSNNSDPNNSKILRKEAKHKDNLSKVEQLVKQQIDFGETDDDIFEFMMASKKFKGIEVREAIAKMRG